MITKTLFTTLSLVVTMTSFGQEMMGCGTHLSPKEEELFRQSLPQLKKWKKAAKKAETPYIIPVVFHVLSDGSNANPYTKEQMKCRMDDAIEMANKDFKGLFPKFQNSDPRFDAVKTTMDVEFVLATVDPDGNLLEVPGMDWHPEVHMINGYDPKMYDYIWFGKNNKYYLDITLVDEPNPSQGAYSSGHAFLPVQDVVPHVTFNHRYIGSTCGSQADPGFAKVLTHEFGHYFGLRHTFHEGCDAVNDGMDDTPPTKGSEGCERDVLNDCGVYPNLENYMDYNVSCQIMFTKDQTRAMTYWLDDASEAFYPRFNLWQESNLIAVGILESAPKADFSSNTTAICYGETVTFKDASVGLPSSYSWTFEGATPATSTERNPSVTYYTEGAHKVTLVVTNSKGTDTKIINDLIEVGQESDANLTEDFSGNFPPRNWAIENPDKGLTWEKRSDIGNGDSSSIIMNNSDNSTIGEEDYLRLPFFDFTNANNSQLFFDVAYTKFDADSPDILIVQVSTDCGASWSDVYTKTHTELETIDIENSDLSNTWKPLNQSDWRKEIINLSQFQGQENISIRFKNVSGYGTRIWIDNVSVAIQQSDTPITDFTSSTRSSKCNSVTIPFFDSSTGNPTSWNWSFPGGSPSTSTEQNPTITYDTPGNYSVSLTTSNASGEGTSISKNDFINIVEPQGNSFTQDFEGDFIPQGWEIINLDNGLTWEKSTQAGRNSASCMVMNNADNATVGAIDDIILNPLDLSLGRTDFSFDVAYAKFDTDSPDVLGVFISTDCGNTWNNVYSKTHTVLETYISDAPNDWIPSLDEHWRTERISLEEYKGESNVLVKFQNTSGYGARIWIDNIQFTFDSKTTPFSEFSIDQDLLCGDLPIQFTDNSFGNPTSWNWSFPGGIPLTSTEQNPSVVYNTPGQYDVTLIASNAYGEGTNVTKSNIVSINSKNTLPVVENFEGDFPIENWVILNPDQDAITWEKRSDVGNGDSSSMIINNADNPTDLVDELILNPLDLQNSSTPFLHFDLAYTQFRNAFDNPHIPAPDKIDILVSSDCGTTWNNVYSKGHLELQTVFPIIQDIEETTEINETNDWVPTTASDWRAETVDLSVVKNQKSVLIKFVNTSGYGTRIWFDNFNITNSEVLSNSSFDFSENEISIYPNPSKDKFKVKLPSDKQAYKISVHNILGQLILTQSVGNTTEETINLSNQNNGVYLLKIKSSNGKVYSHKLLKK